MPGPRRSIEVAVAFEATLSDGAACLVPTLWARDPRQGQAALDLFCSDLFGWALELHAGKQADVSLDDLDGLTHRIQPPAGTSLARWGGQGLDAATLAAFFAQHLEIDLAAPASDALPAPGVALPWLVDLVIAHTAPDGVVTLLRDFRGRHATPVSGAWEALLHERMLGPWAPHAPAQTEADQRPRLALDLVLENWAAALLQAMVRRARQLLAEASTEALPNPVMARDLLMSALGCQGAAHDAARTLNQGLRMPSADGKGPAQALADQLQTPIAVAELAALGPLGNLTVRAKDDLAGGWITNAAQAGPIHPAAIAADLDSACLKVSLRATVAATEPPVTPVSMARWATDDATLTIEVLRDSMSLAGPYRLLDVGSPTDAQQILPRDDAVPIAADGGIGYAVCLPASALASDGANPYSLVGADLKTLLQFGLRDTAGHTLPDSAVELHWANSVVLYRDAIPSLDALPGLTHGWTGSPDADNPALVCTLQWTAPATASDPAPVAGAVQRAVYLRFQQMLAASAVSANLTIALGADTLGSVPVLPQLSAWVAAILTQLDGEATDAQVLVCALPVALDRKLVPQSTPSPLPLRLTLHVARPAGLCPQGPAHASVRQADTTIRPQQGAAGVDWTATLAAIAAPLGGQLTLLKPAVAGPVEALWLLNRAMLANTELNVAYTAYSAPSPLAKVAQSGIVAVERLDEPPIDVSVASIDLDDVAARAAAALDGLVDGKPGRALAQCAPASFDALLATRAQFARAAAARLTSIVVEEALALPAASRDWFDAACLEQCERAFAPVALVSMQLALSGTSTTFLHGQLRLSPPDGAPNTGCTLSPTKIALGEKGPCGTFDFLARRTEAGALSTPELVGALAFAPGMVEVVGNGTAPVFYEIVTPAHLQSPPLMGIRMAGKAEAAWTIPLPSRMAPPAPASLQQHCLPDSTAGAASLQAYLRAARNWRYGLHVGVGNGDHIETTAAIVFQARETRSAKRHTDLFEALVAFNYHAQSLARLTAEMGKGAPVDAQALAFYLRLLDRVVNQLETADSSQLSAPGAAPAQYSVRLRSSQVGATWRLAWQVAPAAAQASFAARLANSVWSMDDDHLPPPTRTSDTAADYPLDTGVEAAILGQAGFSYRSVEANDRDILRHTRANATVTSRSNAAPLHDGARLAPAFQFETASLSSPSPLLPHLVRDAPFDLTTGAVAPESITDSMTRLGEALFEGAEGDFACDLSANLHRPLAPQADDGLDPLEVIYPLCRVPVSTATSALMTAVGEQMTAILVHMDLPPGTRAAIHISLRIHVQEEQGPYRPVLSFGYLYLPLEKVKTVAG